MIPHRATLDVSRELAQYVARLLWAERRLRRTPKDSRALSCFWQAVMVLRWFRGERDIPKLGRDHEISRATAYRYIERESRFWQLKHRICTRRWSVPAPTVSPT